MKYLQIKVSEEEKEKIKDFCDREGLNISGWVRKLIREAMAEKEGRSVNVSGGSNLF